MDLDAFSETHAPEWDRLAELTRRRVLDGAEADELARLKPVLADLIAQIENRLTGLPTGLHFLGQHAGFAFVLN